MLSKTTLSKMTKQKAWFHPSTNLATLGLTFPSRLAERKLLLENVETTWWAKAWVSASEETWTEKHYYSYKYLKHLVLLKTTLAPSLTLKKWTKKLQHTGGIIPNIRSLWSLFLWVNYIKSRKKLKIISFKITFS